MFSILSRTAPRRALAQSVRYASQKAPPPPPAPKKTKLTPPAPQKKPETASAGKAPEGSAAAAAAAAAKSADKSASTSGHTPTPPPSEAAPEPSSPITGVPTLDFSPEYEKEFQRTGAKSSKDTLSSNERKRRMMSRVSLALLALAFSGTVVYMGRDWEEEELKAKKLKIEDAPSSRWARTKERFTDLFDYFNKPAWPELLPPPYPPPHQKPYTLLLSIDDLLVTSTWDRKNGWRTAKRPGVDYFLGYISQFYEVVVFTSQPYYTAGPILDKLDRYGFYINYRLFREATRSVDGKIVKDLSYLNRDLSKVVMLDTDPEHASAQPENSIILPKWNGDPKDKGLVAMIPFLESIAIYRPDDVRPILKAYAGKDIPLEWGRKEAEMKAKHIAEWQAKNKHKISSGGSGFSFGSLLGLSDPSVPSQPKNQPPPTYLEMKRAEAQHQYMQEMKYVNDNREELERLLEQDQKAMAAQVPGSLWEAMDQFRGVQPPPGAPNPTGTSAHPPGSVVAAAEGKTN